MKPRTRWIGVACIVLAVTPLLVTIARSGDAPVASRSSIPAVDFERLVAARRLLIRGEEARAESLLRAVIDGDSARPAARMALSEIGRLRYRAKDYRGALDALQRSIRFDPDDADALLLVGICYRELNEPGQALSALRRAAALDPSSADAHFWLGMTLLKSGANREAEAAFDRTVEVDSAGFRAAAASSIAGRLAYKDGRYRDAVRALERAVALDEDDMLSWGFLSMAYAKLGREDDARAAREHAPAARFIDSPLQPPPDSLLLRGTGRR